MVITSDQFLDWLVAQGVIGSGDYISRVIIDAQSGEPIHVYIQRYGDKRLIGNPLSAGLADDLRTSFARGEGE
jgi:hypothetical protein